MIADHSIFVSTHAHTQQQRDAKHAVMHHRSGLLTHFFCFTARNGETRISCFACMCRNCVIYACTCVCVCAAWCVHVQRGGVRRTTNHLLNALFPCQYTQTTGSRVMTVVTNGALTPHCLRFCPTAPAPLYNPFPCCYKLDFQT